MQRIHQPLVLVLVLASCTLEPEHTETDRKFAMIDERLSELEANRARVISETTAGVVSGVLTLNVPADFADVNLALGSLDNAIIASGVTVKIQVADDDSPYVYADPIVIDHRDGDNIQIVGNPANPSQVRFEFGGSDALYVSKGNAIGLLDGVTLDGLGLGGTGVHADNGAVVRLGSVAVLNFDVGMHASLGSLLIADGAESAYNLGNGIEAFGATVSAQNALVEHNGGNGLALNAGSVALARGAQLQHNDGSGLVVWGGGYADVDGAYCFDNGVMGVYAKLGSVVQAGDDGGGFTSSQNGGSGVNADLRSVVDVRNSDIQDNGEGIESGTGSWVATTDSSITGNSGYALEILWGATVFANSANIVGDIQGPTDSTLPDEGSYLYR